MVMDGGLPTQHFTDVVESFSDIIDVIKLGWGTSLVTKDLKHKVATMQELGIAYYFGGTLFERFVMDHRVDDWVRMCEEFDCRHVEISNGTIPMCNDEKAEYIARFADRFTVFSEVGYKDQDRSEGMLGENWVDYIREDLDAGASIVITEARESGKSGICDRSGHLKHDLIDEIATSGVELDKLMFEAPAKDVQVALIKRFGPEVNLGNISTNDVIALETLRLGLRGDTLLEMNLRASHPAQQLRSC